MKLETYQYQYEDGWSSTLDSSLDSDSTIVLVFSSPEYNYIQEALQSLRDTFPQSTIAGCSSSGEIYDNDVYDLSLSVAVICMEKTEIRRTTVSLETQPDSALAGRELADKLKGDGLKSILVLSDGLSVNGSQLVQGLREGTDPGVVITGGLGGDGDRFERTWIIYEGHRRDNHIAAIGFYGDAIQVGHGSRGGWDMLGPKREVTRSHDNILYELDGQPALELYKRYLGELAEGLPATGLRFPLAINNPEENVDDTVRTILAVDEVEQSITFAGDIPQGALVTLMRANFDRLIDGAADAASAIDASKYSSGPLLAVSISCVGRRLVLGPRTEEEIDAVKDGLPDEAQHIGFYSYGEISPLASGKCDLHNQTMTITLFWEDI